ncbi:hypothetical protein [Leucobacter massiliensis]|uniref:DNA-binding protein n=1 Tax=Leucobacter massiliensis TaxID=1686285 RepID=A0A2S9QMX3_9MICO|nr:hypothetical protein [Leucobacter massiliensis]PRI10932.1 hypothetical protein B4915_08595 [Leucobacter massiliensis]
MSEWLTYREAAAKVGRSRRALQRWRRRGMPMRIDDRGRKIVHEVVLYAWYRKNLQSWPAHQAKMRRIMRDTPTDTRA